LATCHPSVYGIDRIGLVRSLGQGHDEYQNAEPEPELLMPVFEMNARSPQLGDPGRWAIKPQSHNEPKVNDIDSRLPPPQNLFMDFCHNGSNHHA
jgi:hypothetical protein